MISADALIHAVQLRMQVARQWRRPPGDFPDGWQQWLDSIRERVGAVTGASVEDLMAVLLERPLKVPPGRVSELTRWQAFTTLWRQEWHAQESDDERRWHWIATGISGGWHLFLAGMLAWLMYLDLVNVAHPPPRGEALVVQIEYVGDGTPEEIGGGPEPETVAPAEPVQASETTATLTAAPAPSTQPPLPSVAVLPVTIPTPTLQASVRDVVEREIPRPVPPVVDQPLMVSEPVPDRTDVFVLPAPTPRIEVPTIAMPELSAPAPTVEAVDIPRVPRPSVQRLPQSQIEQPVLQPDLSEVIVREVSTPVPRAVVPVIRPPRPAPPELEAAAPAKPAARAHDQPRPVAATAGPEKTPASGGWPSPQRADDWGAAERERPGAQKGEPPGLYNSDGSVRLAETPGSASPGQAPGVITEEIADLDRAGTWLRRPPNDYEPTAFAQYWRPNESLLEEWVRKSVTTIRIPIPGTNKYIECTTVMLVMGGGCGIGDPNLNEQPATARPPPDIPFKPELQEGNGSVPPPAG